MARDARALRRVLSGVTSQQRWEGGWRDPVASDARTSGYGTERFYHRAADSARAIELAPTMRAGGVFAVDTASRLSGDVPSWRHAGVDIAVARGTAVRAPGAGSVADVGDYVLTGRTVVLDHGQGVFSAYFHLDTVLVRRGDDVRRGAALARSGDTGLSTGPHLHYGIYIAGRDVDPAAWKAAVEWMARGDTGRVARRE
jgi:murein DD-endopeptidase MepM/ murein hydrolase activator NlpD